MYRFIHKGHPVTDGYGLEVNRYRVNESRDIDSWGGFLNTNNTGQREEEKMILQPGFIEF